jgi:small conductance mechanosensitive channel
MAADTATTNSDPSALLSLEGVTEFASFWTNSGKEIVIALFWVVIGIVIMQHGGRWLQSKMAGWKVPPNVAKNLMLVWWTVLGFVIAWNLLRHLGFEPAIVRRVLLTGVLIFIAVVLLIRPYIPKLPFRVGNLIRSGDHVGKVVDISLLNTRLKTFDGLTVVVPNATVMNSTLVNYHTLPNRRLKLDLAIAYSQDINEAKRLVEAQMVADPRVLPTPRPVVYVTRLDYAGVHLGARCWVKNPKAWVTRCDILEKLKYEFDRKGIEFAFPRHELIAKPEDPVHEAIDMMHEAEFSRGGANT